MILVDTRDIPRIVADRIKLVARLVALPSILWHFVPHAVTSNFSKNSKKVNSCRELNDMPAWWNW